MTDALHKAPVAMPWSAPATWGRILALILALWALAWIGLRFAPADNIASPVWLPAGLAVAAVVWWGLRALPAIVPAAFAVELAAGVPPGWALAIAAGSGLEAAIGGQLIARAGGPRAIERLGGLVRFGAAAFLAAIPAATLGALGLIGSGLVASDAGVQTWGTWYLGDLVGIVIVTPFLLGLTGWSRRWPTFAQTTEGLAALTALAISAVVAFWLFTLPIVFLIVPPIVWVALRLGPRVTAAALLGLDIMAVLGTKAGHGPFIMGPGESAILILQVFMVTLSLFCLALAALAGDRRRSALELESRVAERTASLAELNDRLRKEVDDRARAQAEVEEAQRIAQMGTWHWDITKPNAVWSPELFRIYGLDPATHVPTYADYLTRVHPDDVERVKSATNAVFNDQKAYSHDERIRRPDGTWRHLHTWARAITDGNGKLVALAGTCQDITDRVSQETKFRDLLESAPDAMIIADEGGRIVLANTQAGRVFGYTREEMLGSSIDMLVPDAARVIHAGHRRNYGEHPRPRAMGAGLDLRARRKDGSEFPVEVSLSPLQTPEGLLVSSAIRDITQRRKDAQDLEESLQRFRALADASPIGIVHTTATGIVDYANTAWLQLTGVADYHEQEAVRRAVHPEDQAVAAAQWRQCVQEGIEFTGDLRFVHADGQVRLARARAVPVRDAVGTITGFVSVVQDMTDARAAEESRLKEREAQLEVRRLRELADFKTNFLRTAAHELGTPLTPIKIQLRILRSLIERRAGVEEGKAMVILDRNLSRLEVLVRDLLESARLESGRLRLNPRPMDLAHVVHDVVESFQEQALEKGINLDAAVPSELPIDADPDRVTQVLYNLLSNAMKFTPSRGRVHVVAQEHDGQFEVVVSDSGLGFSPDQAAKLFQPFSQLHDPMQSTRAGSGLGLYICKGIVEQHGGSIEALSPGPGQGATFRFTLPRTASPLKPGPGVASPEAPAQAPHPIPQPAKRRDVDVGRPGGP